MGKASIIYVLGLAMLVAYAQLNINSAGGDAMDNYMDYYGLTMARNIASSGANMGCSELFLNPAHMTPYTDLDFMNGKLNVRFVESGNRKFVISVGRLDVGPHTLRDTVIAELHNETLARYAWFTALEANAGGTPTTWSTGDTAWGPTHTNDKFNINGTPIFKRKATAWQKAVPNKNGAIFEGGYEWGIKIPFPTNLNSFVTAALDPQGRSVTGTDAVLTFNPGGSARLQVPATGYDSVFSSTTALTANGALAVFGANLYVQGTVTGDLAVGAMAAGGLGGNVFITGDIRYATDPMINPNSTDKLGVYAERNIQVTYDVADPAAAYNRRVDASIFTLTGALEVQDATSHPPRGRLTTLGALLQYRRGPIGDVNPGSGALLSGYYKNFRYDDRLATNPPKFFPSSGRYTLFAWREG